MLTPALSLLALAATSTAHAINSSKGYHLAVEYSGSTFFNDFDFYTGPDPTNGHVRYVDPQTAAKQNLAGYLFYENTTRTHAYIGVNHVLQAPEGRDSVRIMSRKTFSPGMLTVVDVHHAPSGPSLWGAVWLLANDTTTRQEGKGWPNHGEIDLMEWVNDDTFNAMTLHSNPGCSIDNNSATFAGELQHKNCNTKDGSLGCSILAPETIGRKNHSLATAGADFNAQGGGVYILEWTHTGITTWLFPRHDLPRDLAAGHPDPSTWPNPLAKFHGKGCDFAESFQNMQIIINIDVCGDWAGKQEVWEEQGMAGKTGFGTCNEFAAANPRGYRDAYFDFASVKVYLDGSKPKKAPGLLGKREEGQEGHGVEFDYIDIRDRYLESVASDEIANVTASKHWGHGHYHVHRGKFAHRNFVA